eukprot:COSAG06_NODE_49920_length_322_cov_0.695067_2_plen_36_part_01
MGALLASPPPTVAPEPSGASLLYDNMTKPTAALEFP